MNSLLFIIFVFFTFFLPTHSIIGGDAGDLVTASFFGGNPHPPGFPLYTLLNYLLIHLLPRSISNPSYSLSLFSWLFFVINTFLVYRIIKLIIKDETISLASSFFFAFTYPILTYSLIPEVFSFISFFILLFYYLIIQYANTKKEVFIYFITLCFSLGLTHHHLMILVVPSVIYFYFTSNKDLKSKIDKILFNQKKIISLISLFFLGFLVYFYSFFAAKNNPIINWVNPTNLSQIFKLIIRADYGGIFSIGEYALFDLFPRTVSTLTFFIFIFDSLKIYGLIIVFLGLFYLFRYQKNYFDFFVLNFFLILFFYFLAGIPLSYPINTAVYEKFLSVFLYLFILPYAFGLIYIKKIIFKYLDKKKALISFIFILVIILPILLLARINLHYQLALKNDQTAENFAKDILKPMEKNSIVFLNQDTVLFNIQYFHLVKKYRPDIALIHTYRLREKSYRQKLIETYSFVNWKPFADDISLKNLNNFFYVNQDKTIYSDIRLNIKKGYFYPMGILWQYSIEKPKKEYFVKNIKNILPQYQKINPQTIKFRNLFLKDIVRLYSEGYFNMGKYLFDNFASDKAVIKLAKQCFNQSLSLDNRLNNRPYLAQIALLENDCNQAEKLLLTEFRNNPFSKETAYFLMMIYDTCKKNEQKKEMFKKTYQNLLKKTKISIE